jgi:AcrR family transcriptional regulator
LNAKVRQPSPRGRAGRDAAEAAQQPSDGRRQRSANSARRIVEAMITLVRAGNLAPSAEAVSKQADVSLRTVFRHFEDMDSLYLEMSAVIEAEVVPLVTAPLPEVAWPELLTELIARRARVFEHIMPFKLAGNLRRHQSALLMRRHLDFSDMQRRVLAEVAPPTLRGDVVRFEALDLVLCFESWHRLRDDQRLSVARAQAVLLAAGLALTAAAGA